MEEDARDRTRLLRRLAWAGAALAFGLIVLGGVVRISGSGLGCGNHWPMCNGRWFPPLDDLRTVIEWSHRWVASLVSVVVLAVAVTAWTRHRGTRRFTRPASVALLLLVVQVLLGAVTVKLDLPPWVIITHLLNAMLLLATLIVLGLHARQGGCPGRAAIRHRNHGLVHALAMLGFVVILFGGQVANFGAGLVCLGFPLCNGSLAPPASTLAMINWTHRLLAFTFVALALITAYRIRRSPAAGLRRAAFATAALAALQVVVAAVMVLHLLPPVWRALHLLVGTAVWASLVVLVFVSSRTGDVVGAALRGRPTIAAGGADAIADVGADVAMPGADVAMPGADVAMPGAAIAMPGAATEGRPYGDRGGQPDHRGVVRPSMMRDFVTLTKPRIISLLLVTTVAPMFITPAGMPSFSLVLWVIVGGYLMAGGANAINMWFDRDIDTRMTRTRLRPIPSGRMAPATGLAFGITLGVVAFAVFWYFVNPLSAWLALSGLLFYVLIYTMWLKRTTTQNIVVGGAAGAFPPLVGWAAMTGHIDLAAIYLFAIIFYWTPPHFWALALMKQGEYAKAGVPMMPVVRGNRRTKVEMLIYTLFLIPLTVMPSFFGALGPFYLVAALLLGARLLWYCVKLLREPTVTATAWKMYRFSLLYLALLFVAMGIDRALPWGHRPPAGELIILGSPEPMADMPVMPAAGPRGR